jgi:hypothetical protein
MKDVQNDSAKAADIADPNNWFRLGAYSPRGVGLDEELQP